jgi:iron complex transport system substrate-binding protein
MVFASTAPSSRVLGRALGVGERGETLAAYAEDLLTRVDAAVASMPEAQRTSVYLARGPQGLETGLKGSINTEIIERAGGRNVADPEDGRRGIANVSPEQILLWHPDVIVTWDRNFLGHAAARQRVASCSRGCQQARVSGSDCSIRLDRWPTLR